MSRIIFLRNISLDDSDSLMRLLRQQRGREDKRGHLLKLLILVSEPLSLTQCWGGGWYQPVQSTKSGMWPGPLLCQCVSSVAHS